MVWTQRLWLRLVTLFRGKQAADLLEDEMEFHLEQQIAENVAAGMSREEARYGAMRAFGNPTVLKEETRDAWGWVWLEQFATDLKYGARSLRKSPGFTAVAILTLVLGIGASTTIFSVMNATLFKRLPFPEPDRVVLIWETYGSRGWNIMSAPNFWDFQRESRSFQAMAIFDSDGRGYNLSARGDKQDSEQVSGVRISADFFSVLGVTPFLGRSFLREEEILGRDHEVILSYGLWKLRYGGDPALIGKSIKIDGEDFTVVGVMPEKFQWQFWSGLRQLWVPVGFRKTDYDRGMHSFVALGRLRPGVTRAQAEAELKSIAGRAAEKFPKDDPGMGAAVSPISEFDLEGFRTAMLALLVAVGLLLLIACVNIANLLLARGAGRQKEFATRRALGAASSRIARQLLTESFLLAIVGAAAALPVAAWSNQLLFRVFHLENLHLPLRVVDSIPMNGRVFGFALLLSCVTSVLFGLAPAVNVLRGNMGEPLKEGGRGSTQGGRGRLRNTLVALEVALALVLMCGAGLMIESLARLLEVNPGLNAKNVLTVQVSVPQKETYTGPPDLPRFCQDIDEHIGATPGVVSVSAVSHLPFEGTAGRSFQIEGRAPADPEHMPYGDYGVACPNYFRTMGIPILNGREFLPQDTVSATATIVINESMARAYWPKENPVGRAVRLGGLSGPRLTIVGIVGDVHHRGLDEPVRRQFFRPYAQAGWPMMSLVVRTISEPAHFAEPIKKALADVLPDRPISQVQTMEEIVHDSTGSRRFPMLLLSTFSLLALLLAAVGIIGVVSYSVTQRRHEMGIRMALGACSGDVLRLVLRGGMTWVIVGVMVGIGGAIGFGRALSGLLYGVRPSDPLVIGGVSVLLTAVALLANYFPARRATRVDPMVALRYE